MKRSITLIIITVLCAVSLFAQAPEKFSYQAVVRNASNQLVTNAPVGVRVSILQGSANGSAVYVETQTATTNANGLITLQIGGGNVQQGVFVDIDWANGPFFLKTETDPNGGSDYTVTSTQQLLSVPYALYAREAGNSFSGDYNDLTNTPTIPTVPAYVSAFSNDAGYLTNYTETDPVFNAWDKDYDDLTNKPTLFSGDYNDLTNQPTIPTVPADISVFNNDAGYITSADIPSQVNADWEATAGVAQILHKPTLFSGNYNDLTNKPTLFSGSYNDLTDKPTLFSGNYNDLTNKPTLFSGNYNDLTNKPVLFSGSYYDLNDRPVLFDGDYNSLSNRPNLATVATTGSYNDLSEKPTIPTVPTNVSAFSNDAGYITAADIPEISTVPTNVSAFTNDAGYITTAQIPAQVNADWNATAGAAQILNKPTIPTVPSNVSAFNNDAGYITSADIPEISNVPTNVSAFNNDAGYVSNAECTGVNLCDLATNYAQLNTLLTSMNNTIDSLRDRIEELELNPGQSVPAQTLGSVTTSDMTYVGVNSAVGGGNVTSDGGGSILARGLCWSTSNPPYITDSHTNEGTAVGQFTSSISGLNPGTTYYVRAYVTNSVGTAYGSVVSFTTNSSDTPVLPTVTTVDVTNIAPYTATFHGNVVYNGGTALLARGFVYGLGHNPTLENNFTVDGIIEGTFSSTVTGLSANMTYYVRAYATNSVGTVYGEEISFVSSTTPPAVTTAEVTSISYTSAACGGDVPFSGGEGVTSKGLCYGVNEHPTISDNLIHGGAGVGSFTGNLTGLTANTVYYVRAFATNSVGTNYGEERVFSTLSYQTPTVEAVAPTDITYTTFTCGGNVTDEGSFPVTSRGVCWSTSPNPTTNDNYEPRSSGTGAFSYTIFGLSPNTTYYVRAYAINQVGQAYSEQMIVTTLANTKPTVTTLSASGLGKCIGNITSTGGLSITDRGFCYSTYPNPTIVESHVSVDAGDDQFSAMLPDLVEGTTYYVCAYATNMIGTAYGQQISFTYNCGGSYTVTDYDGNTYPTVRIGNQCWMKENLRSTHFPNGTAIQVASNPTGYFSSNEARYSSVAGLFTYGRLYNWAAVKHGSISSQANPSGVQGICPNGWHVPSDAEWDELENYVSSHPSQYFSGGCSSVAKALASTTNWSSSGTGSCLVGNNTNSNNTTGFNALPAGYYYNSDDGGSPSTSNTISSYYSSSPSVGRGAGFWSCTSADGIWGRTIDYNSSAFVRKSFKTSTLYYIVGSAGTTTVFCHDFLSVRCLRD